MPKFIRVLVLATECVPQTPTHLFMENLTVSGIRVALADN